MTIIGLISSLWMPTFVGAQQADTTEFDVLLQRAAMHQHTRGDIDTYADTVNAYRIDGTIDATSRTWSAQQSLFYINTSAETLDELPLRLFANLPDLGGRTDLSNVMVDGEAAEFRLLNADYIAMVALPRPLAPGERLTLSCDFVTQIPWNVGRTCMAPSTMMAKACHSRPPTRWSPNTEQMAGKSTFPTPRATSSIARWPSTMSR